MRKNMVNPHRTKALAKVSVLASIVLALPLGLISCVEQQAPPTTVLPTASPLPSASADPSAYSPAPAESPSPVAVPNTTKADVYWLSGSGTQLKLAPANLEIPSSDADTQLKTAVERLLKGPANSNVTSSIPTETKLNSFKVKNDGVHIDLSKAFTSGGGSTSMQGRLGQVIYTASSLKPTEPIWISVDGEPLKVLGGEGLEVSQPMTRSEFDKNFSIQ